MYSAFVCVTTFRRKEGGFFSLHAPYRVADNDWFQSTTSPNGVLGVAHSVHALHGQGVEAAESTPVEAIDISDIVRQ